MYGLFILLYFCLFPLGFLLERSKLDTWISMTNLELLFLVYAGHSSCSSLSHTSCAREPGMPLGITFLRNQYYTELQLMVCLSWLRWRINLVVFFSSNVSFVGGNLFSHFCF